MRGDDGLADRRVNWCFSRGKLPAEPLDLWAVLAQPGVPVCYRHNAVDNGLPEFIDVLAWNQSDAPFSDQLLGHS